MQPVPADRGCPSVDTKRRALRHIRLANAADANAEARAVYQIRDYPACQRSRNASCAWTPLARRVEQEVACVASNSQLKIPRDSSSACQSGGAFSIVGRAM